MGDVGWSRVIRLNSQPVQASRILPNYVLLRRGEDLRFLNRRKGVGPCAFGVRTVGGVHDALVTGGVDDVGQGPFPGSQGTVMRPEVKGSLGLVLLLGIFRRSRPSLIAGSSLGDQLLVPIQTLASSIS